MRYLTNDSKISCIDDTGKEGCHSCLAGSQTLECGSLQRYLYPPILQECRWC